ncbi:unnamed protein product [Adineta ricciae]|uniref:PDZ domain-containing protein n=1 Tax=Adineta ricciae TaxID=249248 RepID=A0A816DLR1_ADIRI|nr:unnamed protein product [Adineta ricciae]
MVKMILAHILQNSQASNTPLCRFDRIIEIDDEFMENESTEFVVEKLLKARSRGFIKLYVVDTEACKFYKTNKLPLSPEESEKKTFPPSIQLFPWITKKAALTLEKETMHEPQSASKFFLSLFVAKPGIRWRITVLRADATDPTGFELTYDNEKHYHSINITSDAKSTGIKSGDCLIEINDENIEHLVPKALGKHIHNIRYPDPLQMLVVETSTYDDHQAQNLPHYAFQSANEHVSLELEPTTQRFLDVEDESRTMRLPVEGYQRMPWVTLTAAMKNLEALVPAVNRNASIAKVLQ